MVEGFGINDKEIGSSEGAMGSFTRLGVVVRVRCGHTESMFEGGRRDG